MHILIFGSLSVEAEHAWALPCTFNADCLVFTMLQVWGPPMHTATGPPNPAWSKTGSFSSSGDPPTHRQPDVKQGDLMPPPADLEEAGSLLSIAHGHLLLGIEQPPEHYGLEANSGTSPAALEASGAADSSIAAAEHHLREAVTEASGGGHGSENNIVTLDATTEAVMEASGAAGDSAGSIARSRLDGDAREAGVEASGAASSRVLRGAGGKIHAQENLLGPSRRLLDVFGESLRHVDNLLNARWDLERLRGSWCPPDMMMHVTTRPCCTAVRVIGAAHTMMHLSQHHEMLEHCQSASEAPKYHPRSMKLVPFMPEVLSTRPAPL